MNRTASMPAKHLNTFGSTAPGSRAILRDQELESELEELYLEGPAIVNEERPVGRKVLPF